MAADPIRVALFGLLDDDDVLTGLASGGIHHLRAPAAADFPLCIFHKQSGLPIWSMRDASTSELWLVKGICRGEDQEEAEAIDARCQALLNDAEFLIAGAELLGIRRDLDVVYPEDDAGETLFHVGGLYRIQTLPTS